MPLHISEIGVRLTVGGTSPASPRAGGTHPAAPAQPAASAIPPDKIDEIISIIVQRVLEQLRAFEAR